MKQYKVEITKEALQDMEDIYNYIAIDLLAPDNAMGQYNRIADEILTLDTFPERFRIMDSESEKRWSCVECSSIIIQCFTQSVTKG